MKKLLLFGFMIAFISMFVDYSPDSGPPEGISEINHELVDLKTEKADFIAEFQNTTCLNYSEVGIVQGDYLIANYDLQENSKIKDCQKHKVINKELKVLFGYNQGNKLNQGPMFRACLDASDLTNIRYNSF